MKISDITENNNNNAKVKNVQGDKVTIDNGDGTELTVDTKKNQNVIDQDDDGNVSVNPDTGNSAQNRTQQNRRIRPGQKVNVQSS
jgi:hypothetical protein